MEPSTSASQFSRRSSLLGKRTRARPVAMRSNGTNSGSLRDLVLELRGLRSDVRSELQGLRCDIQALTTALIQRNEGGDTSLANLSYYDEEQPMHNGVDDDDRYRAYESDTDDNQSRVSAAISPDPAPPSPQPSTTKQEPARKRRPTPCVGDLQFRYVPKETVDEFFHTCEVPTKFARRLARAVFTKPSDYAQCVTTAPPEQREKYNWIRKVIRLYFQVDAVDDDNNWRTVRRAMDNLCFQWRNKFEQGYGFVYDQENYQATIIPPKREKPRHYKTMPGFRRPGPQSDFVAYVPIKRE